MNEKAVIRFIERHGPKVLPFLREVPRSDDRLLLPVHYRDHALVIHVDEHPRAFFLHADGFDAVAVNLDVAHFLVAGKYDLILLDINLPGISGVDTCRGIHQMSASPIVMLTVREASKDKIEALDAGACDYVTKPFAMGELLARIRAVLRRAPSMATPGVAHLKLDDVEINFEARRVIVSGKPVRLTSKEFDLLLYLAIHRNRTIPHRELLREVWGSEHVDERKYLRVFVNRLRRKIEATPHEPKFLLTEPFVGYRLYVPQLAFSIKDQIIYWESNRSHSRK